jgi:hypothetical protein
MRDKVYASKTKNICVNFLYCFSFILVYSLMLLKEPWIFFSKPLFDDIRIVLGEVG